MDEEFYEEIGGEEFFTKLVAKFYGGVETDPILRPMYPEGDLSEAQRHLLLFMIQRCGGPATYQAERGHPRLRMRHMPFVIDGAARDAWLTLMRNSLDELNVPNHLADELWVYLVTAAHSLMNAPE
jgi:hemoglobin